MKLVKKYYIHAVIIMAALMVVLSILFPPIASAATLDEIHLSWQNDPRTTMTIMWRTEVNVPAKVQYGPTISYGYEAVGTSGPAVQDGFYYNTTELTGLSPNTLYHYRLQGESNLWSGDYTFRTAPDGSADFSFTAFADNGIAENVGEQAMDIKELVALEKPSFNLVPGDLTYADGDWCNGKPCVKEHWEKWLQELELFSHSVPIMTSFGNHEAKTDVKFDSGETFYQRSLALPGTELYYSFDYGDVHFIALNSDDYNSLKPGKAQYEWLARDLQKKNKKWTIVYFHQTTFSTGPHAPVETIQRNVVPLFDQYNVDLVISGHNHHYERTKPLTYNVVDYKTPVIASAETNNYANLDATVYVISGGAGGGLYDFSNEKPAWSVVRQKVFEYIKVNVDDAGIITVTAINTKGETIDQFSLSKNASSPPPPIVVTPEPVNQPGTDNFETLQTIKGFNFAVWWYNILNDNKTKKSIDNLKAAGANYFGLAPFWYQDDKNSAIIYRRSDKTATDESLVNSIRYAKSIDLKVALKPMVDSRDGVWRGDLTPLDANAWFKSYKDFILNYAVICEQEKVDWLIVGTEFDTLTVSGYTDKWREIIQAIRQVYKGKLTYAANWGEYYHVGFWSDLDAIGIDAYFPVADNGNPSVDSVKQAWSSKGWLGDINSLRTRYNKQVILTEIGFLSCDGSGIEPWKYPCDKDIDLQEQATLYEGTLKFWKDKEWMLGYLFWRWDVDPDAGGSSSGDYVPQNKQPVLDVLKRGWIVSQSSSSSSGSGSSGSSGGSSSASSGSSSSSNNSTAQSGGVLINAIPLAGATFPTDASFVSFAYGQARIALSNESKMATDLSNALKTRFKGIKPIKEKNWQSYVNAYVYGGYPIEAIIASVEHGGKTVHASIPWSAWKKSKDCINIMGEEQKELFIYGKVRLPYLDEERAKAWELSLKLQKYFNGPIPLSKKLWPVYINAYIYGEYPVEAIARSIQIGGKTVHVSIPWPIWRNSKDYLKYMK